MWDDGEREGTRWARRVEENLRGSREPDQGVRQARQAAVAQGEHGLGPTNGADDSGVELPGTPELALFGLGSASATDTIALVSGPIRRCDQYHYRLLVRES